MNNRTGGYIPKSRIEKITTTLGKTIGRDKLRDGNAISDKPIKGRKVSSDNDKYLTKSEIRSIKTTDGRLIKRDFIKDGNFLKNASVKHPKVSRTQFEDEEYEYARGGSVDAKIKKFVSDLADRNKKQFSVDEYYTFRDKNFGIGVSRVYFTDTDSNYSKFDNMLGDALNVNWENNQHYKNGGAVDSETQAKIDKIEKFINNPENQKNDPATVEKFRSILASIKPKASAPATPKVEPKATAPKRTTAPAKPRVTATAPKKPIAPAKPRVTATATPRATAPKKAEPQAKTSKGVKVTGSSSVTVDGKEMDMNSKEFCDYLLKQFRDRREKSKNAPKKKTASVMAKITANVEKSVVQAIKSSVASNKKEIEKNPNFFVKKVEKLESSTKSFLQSMKDVLGDDFKQGEIASTMKSIEELTESLIAKYKTK